MKLSLGLTRSRITSPEVYRLLKAIRKADNNLKYKDPKKWFHPPLVYDVKKIYKKHGFERVLARAEGEGCVHVNYNHWSNNPAGLANARQVMLVTKGYEILLSKNKP